ncbi:MAG: nuclear transport factor 2 family protein [Planctomycetota bacterium]
MQADDRSQEPVLATLQGLVDAWHRAAATGDFDAYFGRMTEDAVFLGTDATERWVGVEFRDFARPYFDGPTAYGDGAWTYEPLERFVSVSNRGDVAWFDELLRNEKYGVCRGTGVLVRGRVGWKIAHYSLSFMVPNEVAGDVVDVIGADEAP